MVRRLPIIRPVWQKGKSEMPMSISLFLAKIDFMSQRASIKGLVPRTLLVAVFCLASILISNLVSNLAQASDSLRLIEVKGEPTIKARKEISRREIRLKSGDDLLPGDEIETSSDQVVVLQSVDGSIWNIGKDSSLKVHERSKVGGGSRMLILHRGALLGVGKDSKAGKVLSHKISTKYGVLGLRNGTFFLEVTDREGKLDTLSGESMWGKDWELRARSSAILRPGYGLNFSPTVSDRKTKKKKTKWKPIRRPKAEIDARLEKYGLDKE